MKNFQLLLFTLLFSSCSAYKDFHGEKMSRPSTQVRIYATCPLLYSYTLLTGIDEEQNYYNFIVKDAFHSLKKGDFYPAK